MTVASAESFLRGCAAENEENIRKIGTLINEEALLFAKFLRNERETWIPRITGL